jgi:glyoxylate carboligase
MAYADADQLAAALRTRVTAENQQLLDDCLAAAAEEIDFDLDRTDPLPVPTPLMVVRVNVNRAVEWFKAADVNAGSIGTEQTGVMTAPDEGFGKWSLTLRPFKQQWGVA